MCKGTYSLAPSVRIDEFYLPYRSIKRNSQEKSTHKLKSSENQRNNAPPKRYARQPEAHR
ncbi:protein of unknown function [Pseudomonas sp. JV551A1]|uniref:Uncharacterized protein n=1 Tax=Pseudomonas inefficax TaxID=2078786 RepID=A0AAQ1SUH9_9PSED|nr:protein of unknown function [Pseudomonas sp. JV551A1]SPO62024.1 protein of unknown function [Pseudomonas inefficax]